MRSIDTSVMTERQVKAFGELERHLVSDWGMEGGLDWFLDVQEEIRPGRGHDIRWVAFGGDMRIAQGVVDVYGRWGEYAVADIDPIHTGVDCECDYCLTQEWRP